MRGTIFAVAATLALVAAPACADLFGEYAVTGKMHDGTAYDGSIVFAAAGQVYKVDYCCDRQSGFAIEYRNYLGIAEIADNGGGQLVLYQRVGNNWVGIFTQYAEGSTGAEVLYNGAPQDLQDYHLKTGNPVGKFLISGTNPDGSTYTGEVEITRSGDIFDVDRTTGNDNISGTALALDGGFVFNVNKSDKREPIGVLGLFVPDGNGFLGVWARRGSDKLGAERWVRK